MEEIMKKKTLIVDENLTQRRTIASYLATRFECTDCGSTFQALQLLHDHHYDLIITEMEFSGNTEDDFLSQIKKINPTIRIIMTTRVPSEPAVFTAAKHDADAILVKPISQKILFSKVSELLSVHFSSKKRAAIIARLGMRVQKVGQYAIITLAGRLVSTTFPALKAGIGNLLRRGIRNIALNMEKLTSIDQHGFRLLFQTFNTLKQLSGNLCLFNVVNVLSVLAASPEIMGVMPIYLDETEFKNTILKEYACSMAYPHREG